MGILYVSPISARTILGIKLEGKLVISNISNFDIFGNQSQTSHSKEVPSSNLNNEMIIFRIYFQSNSLLKGEQRNGYKVKVLVALILFIIWCICNSPRGTKKGSNNKIEDKSRDVFLQTKLAPVGGGAWGFGVMLITYLKFPLTKGKRREGGWYVEWRQKKESRQKKKREKLDNPRDFGGRGHRGEGFLLG